MRSLPYLSLPDETTTTLNRTFSLEVNIVSLSQYSINEQQNHRVCVSNTTANNRPNLAMGAL